jgi:hypothetical protein
VTLKDSVFRPTALKTVVGSDVPRTRDLLTNKGLQRGGTAAREAEENQLQNEPRRHFACGVDLAQALGDPTTDHDEATAISLLRIRIRNLLHMNSHTSDLSTD